ncbi:organic solvent tolerance protein, putative [Roseobacter sp. SK209-2-6]|uniref:LPS-assembly protein LptD n=1 Tax=Roseobacter sp. SK209-2-6 TaxID=388739 RepID=UPI0000F3E81D|nr:LPS assembly protein LptD [Roseobacter sp. SK209-2-6]EBA16210.1 organic solvent tolerance protein, putative [Roseobacter sp. SK209-2-6]
MRRALLLSVVLPWIVFSGPVPAQTQPPASETTKPAALVADQVFITSDRRLIAKGNVEAFQADIRLRAKSITFDQTDGALQIEGPIRIDQGGEITILADAAEMDRSLRDGILMGARMVFQQQLQLSSLQMSRTAGRYTQLYKTSVTSCHVCEDGRPPLWQIRAERVIHDQLEQQLYFEHAQLRVLDVPVFYFPAVRLPDPTLERSSGFLVPSTRTTSNLGTGAKIPYFFTLGPHKDLTLSPYLSPKTRTLDWRYRQAFHRGNIELNGAYTRDDLQPGEGRGYIFAEGNFHLRSGYRFEFDLKTVSDDGYIADYGLPDKDRLRSEISLTKAERASLIRARLINFKTLRDSEDQELIPSSIIDIFYQRRFFPNQIGGEARTTFELLGLNRSSDIQGNLTNANGRDQARFTADFDWRRNWIFAGGTELKWEIGAAADGFITYDDAFFSEYATRVTPRSALTLRRPMTRREASGATQHLEPILQLGWSNSSGDTTASEESDFVEFDQGNLLSLSRFPASDAREDGVALAYGFNWARFAPSGWQAAASIGQVIRQDADTRFTKSSGLSDTASDLLLAGQIKFNNELALSARGLLNDSINFSKAEVRGDWKRDDLSLTGSYLWLGSDPAEGRSSETSEVWVDGSYEISPSWKASANLRYDISDARATRAGLGLAYSNECVTVDLSVNRRYTSTTSVDPSTDFGFTISLNGFSVNNGSKQYRRSCRNS